VNRLRQWAKAAIVRARHARNESERIRLGQNKGTLPPELWGLEVNAAGHLTVRGHDSVDLAHRYGTPLYVIDRPRLRDDFQRFSEAFRGGWPDVQVGYSYKTNPLPGVIRELHELGAWAEVISHFELWLALQLGVRPERIIYNGPAKSVDGLELAISRRIRLINVDNLDEIERIGRIAREMGVRQQVGVRVVTSVGWSGQFGHNLASGEAIEAFARLAEMDSVDPCGLHIHLGTGLKDIATYLQAIREVLDFAREVEGTFGLRIRYLDFGGGFGKPTVRPMDAWDERLGAMGYPPGPIDPGKAPTIEAFGKAITDVLRQHYRGSADAALPTVLFEPGRAITSSAQTLLLKALAVKPGPDGSRRVILDGGKNIAIPTGYELHELFPASDMLGDYRAQHHFYGPLCHPGDVLLRCKRFPDVRPNDIVALMDAGAYFVPNQMNFSNPRPAAVLVDVGYQQLIRTRETFENIVQLDDVFNAAEQSTTHAGT
jgi:diaminopimelate decarboxylase